MSNSIKKIFYINLDDCRERRHRMKNMFKLHFSGYKYERFKAVDGRKDNFKRYRKYFSEDCWNDRTDHKGAFGCYLSHLKLYEQILNDKSFSEDDFFLILEDDAVVLPNKLKLLEKIIKVIPKDCLVFYIGLRRKCVTPAKKNGDMIAIPIPKKSQNVGTHSIIIQKKNIPKLLDFHIPIQYRHLDVYTRNNLFSKKVIYCSVDNIFETDGTSVRKQMDRAEKPTDDKNKLVDKHKKKK